MTMEKGARMRALSFMLGDWELDYTVTQHGRTTKPIRGTGSLRYLFDATYLTFDYRMLDKETGETLGGAHGLFAWDAKAQQYRYYWFESSGTFLEATGVLANDDTLALEWQGVNCTQIFRRLSADAMYLEMRCPDQDLLLRVDFSRTGGAAEVSPRA
jgi:hypothetical protein